ncbi:DNA cytosine methyltransferase [Corallococcus sp. bb12-1]|uniref:DNA cytosine methyltransferase n=1 Tax=Corallococcus sp. bb12-1 TaxID=2996784 RepID=UPI002271C433|nr:DNA cytosine methyltransferase [Corallococcus sp. bb12-1]MCY1040411.1 DNA cytosine methyltransferase [Corallococcus sp. bb12-1]
MDLFAGAGGLFLGFHRSGGRSVGGVEFDPLAALTYATNFHGDSLPDEFAMHSVARDITAKENEPAAVMAQWGHADAGAGVDIIVGGPPCPAFARVGRAKLREINQHPEAFRQDPRAKLYLPYLRYVETLAPVALVMENVPDILNYGGHNLAEEICDTLEEFGYRTAYTLLNAANYGVPQMRERFFLMAIHARAGIQPSFPLGSHKVEFPPGYEGSRQVALKHIVTTDLFHPVRSRFVDTPGLVPRPKPAVTAEDALRDLPPITAHLEGRDKRGARRFTLGIPYRDDVAPTSYARELRAWPGFASSGQLMDHVTRCLSDRDYRLFRQMKAGDDYPRAFELAERLFSEALKRLAGDEGKPTREGTKAWEAIRAEYVPPYDHTKFPNKWRKMEPDAPARTLMAHLGKDTYSHIHYDSDQARVISVREAARLQSFPDGFIFKGTMNPAFRQIGNSVPPLLSFALGKHLFDILGIAPEKSGGSVSDGSRPTVRRTTR